MKLQCQGFYEFDSIRAALGEQSPLFQRFVVMCKDFCEGQKQLARGGQGAPGFALVVPGAGNRFEEQFTRGMRYLEDACNLKCPTCRTAFYEWTDCGAVKCTRFAPGR